MTDRVLKLGILGSTKGSNLIPLSLAINENKLPVSIEVILSNVEDAGILAKAKEQHWPAFHLSPKKMTREAYDESLSHKLKAFDVELIVLMGYMKILSPPFVDTWRHRIINAHPSLLPAFAGLMDEAVHSAVLASGATETGCSIHEVDETLDGGPILVQKYCPVYSEDTVDSLKTRVQALEVDAYIDAIQAFYEGPYYV